PHSYLQAFPTRRSADLLTPENIKRVCEKFNFVNEEDLYAAVGYQGITAALIITRLTAKIRKQKEHEQKLEEKIVEAQHSMQDKSDRKSTRLNSSHVAIS